MGAKKVVVLHRKMEGELFWKRKFSGARVELLEFCTKVRNHQKRFLHFERLLHTSIKCDQSTEPEFYFTLHHLLRFVPAIKNIYPSKRVLPADPLSLKSPTDFVPPGIDHLWIILYLLGFSSQIYFVPTKPFWISKKKFCKKKTWLHHFEGFDLHNILYIIH